MSVRPCRGSGPPEGGFTLIEVIGALVIFSLGVIMVLQLTGALSRQMEFAAKTSQVVARAQERLDSLESLPFDSLTLGSRQDTTTILGTPYRLSTTVTAVTAILRQIDLTMAPSSGASGPTYTTTSYSSAPW